MKLALFNDTDFEQPRKLNASDLGAILHSGGLAFETVREEELRRLDEAEFQTLVVPYIRGNFSAEGLDAILKFHAKGGSLLFLGDLPNAGNWYPLWNMQSDKLHLTRCYDEFSVDGLTQKGEEIAGRLTGMEHFQGRVLKGLRVTAFPPDLCWPLLKVKSSSHAESSSAAVAVKRRCAKFLGAKFALVGFNGGEPRESVEGVSHPDWAYDPGLLDRDWKGAAPFILSLLKWLEPERVSSAIFFEPVGSAAAPRRISVEAANNSDEPVSISAFKLEMDGKTVFEKSLSIAPRSRAREETVIEKCPSGKAELNLSGVIGGMQKAFDKATLWTLPEGSSESPSFGFSTYWAFKDSKLTEEFKFFCREMAARGCQYVRMNIPWESLEPEPCRYDWTMSDEALDFAKDSGLLLQFWLFPTTRGSGLSDGGVPRWALKEPAIDRYGNKGFFPSLWSPFYRERYFALVEAFTKRYAESASLSKFIIDFGNSDFPYGYHYYGCDNTVFDYSPHERAAFSKYLAELLKLDLSDASKLYGRSFKSFDEVPVPLSEESEPFRLYLDFRTWSIRQGIEAVHEIVQRNASGKLPEDLPGHGQGSIGDLSSYYCESKAKHWDEERKHPELLVSLHNAGRTWGGEPWQVGGDYRQYDEHLFMSVRLNASYLTIPGADLGLFGEDIAKTGFVRRFFAGATRPAPELAVMGRIAWNAWGSLPNVASRMDVPVDLMSSRHRYDFSCYKLLALPDSDYAGGTVTGGGSSMLVPSDKDWHKLLRDSVEKGLSILVFPETCRSGTEAGSRTERLREVFGLDSSVSYGERKMRSVEFPASFGGGRAEGFAREVIAKGETLLSGSEGAPLLVRMAFGKGAVLLAGYDCSSDSLDRPPVYEEADSIAGHSFVRLCSHLKIGPDLYSTGGMNVFKEMLFLDGKEHFIIFSHLKRTTETCVSIRLSRPAKTAFDIAAGERFPLRRLEDGSCEFKCPLFTRTGRYFAFE